MLCLGQFSPWVGPCGGVRRLPHIPLYRLFQPPLHNPSEPVALQRILQLRAEGTFHLGHFPRIAPLSPQFVLDACKKYNVPPPKSSTRKSSPVRVRVPKASRGAKARPIEKEAAPAPLAPPLPVDQHVYVPPSNPVPSGPPSGVPGPAPAPAREPALQRPGPSDPPVRSSSPARSSSPLPPEYCVNNAQWMAAKLQEISCIGRELESQGRRSPTRDERRDRLLQRISPERRRGFSPEAPDRKDPPNPNAPGLAPAPAAPATRVAGQPAPVATSNRQPPPGAVHQHRVQSPRKAPAGHSQNENVPPRRSVSFGQARAAPAPQPQPQPQPLTHTQELRWTVQEQQRIIEELEMQVQHQQAQLQAAAAMGPAPDAAALTTPRAPAGPTTRGKGKKGRKGKGVGVRKAAGVRVMGSPKRKGAGLKKKGTQQRRRKAGAAGSK